jgi:hypothetical protein
MTTFRNINFTKRDYECTNIVTCEADEAPGPQWVECPAEELMANGMMHIRTENGVLYFGWL